MISFKQLYLLLNEASYQGNIGIMELSQFFARAEKENPELYHKVLKLIKKGNASKEVWKIIQDFLNVQLVDK